MTGIFALYKQHQTLPLRFPSQVVSHQHITYLHNFLHLEKGGGKWVSVYLVITLVTCLTKAVIEVSLTDSCCPFCKVPTGLIVIKTCKTSVPLIQITIEDIVLTGGLYD